MFPVSVYTGGVMLDGQYGVSYSVPSTLSFPAKEEISFDELKVELYRWLALSPARDTLKIRVRFNAAKPPNSYFSEIQVLNNEMWRLIIEKSICTGNWNMLQLYVDAVPISSQPSNVPKSTSTGGGNHVNVGCSNPQADPVSNRRDSLVADCYESIDPPHLSESYSPTARTNRQMTIISGNDGDEDEEDDDILEHYKKKRRRNESSEAADVPTEKEKGADPSSKLREFAYPEPEFFQFDTLRDRNKFAMDQVWAIYDDRDGMPRFYAHIKSLHTAPKFHICFVWFEPDPDKSILAWHRAGLPIATGRFKLGSAQTVDELLMFCHIVSCGKSSKGNSFERYPRKGEVWATFKDWDGSWSSKSGKIRKFEYEMVEVVSDVTDSTGFVVIPLVKINGFVSLFMQSREAAPVVIPTSEMLRFSHSVPLYRITGNERNGVPEGAFELDPASVPPNLDNSFSFNNLDRKPMQKPITNPSSEHKEERKNHGRGKEGDVVDISSQKAHDHGFYSFSDSRSIEKFEPGQIWALYSEINTFPNYYAMVKRVDLGKRKKVHINWLEQYGESVFGVDKSRIDPAFPFGCGVFRLAGNAGDWYEIDAFSHKMTANSGSGKNVYEIKPAKTETWAVYRNWNHGWSTDDIKKCQYDLVRISEVNQAGIKVLFVDKVVGYKAVFRLDTRRKPMEIQNGELMKFSHRIPEHRLTHQVDGMLGDCWELDTAALPESLLC